jgi:hypothetical protein
MKNAEIEDFQGKHHIRCYMKHMFCMFHFVIVLYYFSSLVSFTGGLCPPFLVNLKENRVFSSRFCVPGKPA